MKDADSISNKEPERRSPTRRFALPARLWVRDLLHAYGAAQCAQHAAALSFYALLSFLPILVLLLALSGYVIEWMGPRYGSQAALLDQIAGVVAGVFPAEKSIIGNALRGMMASKGTVGLLGFLMLFASASLVFAALQHALHAVFGAEPRRLFRSRHLFAALACAIGLLLLTARMGFSLIFSMIEGAGYASWLSQRAVQVFIGEAVFVVAVGAGVVAMFKWLCSHWVAWRHALIGALVFVLLWRLAHLLIGLYLTSLARVNLLYGSLAALVVVVIWVYYSASILLLSALIVRRLSIRSRR